MKVLLQDIKSIKPYKKNPRNNQNSIEPVIESIKAYGFQQPIVVDKKGTIIAGHTRYKAALEMGLKKVPVVVADKLNPKQVRAYRIADNKTNEFARWNMPMLKDELEGLDDFFTGVSESEIEGMNFGFEELGEGEKENPQNPQNPQTPNIGIEEVNMSFMLDSDKRDSIMDKLFDIKEAKSFETLSEALYFKVMEEF